MGVLRRRRTWLIGVPAALLLLFVGLPFAYTQWMNRTALKPLTFADLPPEPTTVAAGPTTTDGSDLLAVSSTRLFCRPSLVSKWA